LQGANETLAAIVIGFGFASVVVYWNVPPPELAVMGIVLIQLVNTLNKLQREYQKAVIFESASYSVLNLIAGTEAEQEADPSTRTPEF
jgi:hypothetical protein